MKKVLISLCALLCMNCYYEENADVTIQIDNNSSRDLHISFFPNKFTHSDLGVTYFYKDVSVKKGESVSLIIEFRYKQKFGPHNDVWYGPYPSRNIEKIIFSETGTGEIIKEANNIRELIIPIPGVKKYFFEITDELLNAKGE